MRSTTCSTTGSGDDRQLADGADGQAAAARLVARKARLVEEQDPRALRGEAVAVVDPAGPAPTTTTSKRSTPGSVVA